MRRNFTLFFLALLVMTNTLSAQKRFSFSAGFGYRTNASEFPSLMLNYKAAKNLELSIGPSIHYFYCGQGITGSTRYFYLTGKKIYFDTEVAYRHLWSREIEISPADHESEVGYYFVPANGFVFFAEGINFDIKGKDPDDTSGRLNISICYGLPFKKYGYTFLHGIESAEIEASIMKRITAGLGFSVAFTPGK